MAHMDRVFHSGAHRHLLITDLDGTLACDSQVSEVSREYLRKLGSQGVVRAIATGRSRHGVEKVLGDDFPIDYVVFSSGAGIYDWSRRELLSFHTMADTAVDEILPVIQEHGWGFMLHDPIPENHRFQFLATPRSCPDFHRRLERLSHLGRPLEGMPIRSATQFVVIVPGPEVNRSLEFLGHRLKEYSVIRATSPLDGSSAWIEIFPKVVSKSQGAAWLSQYLGLSAANVVAIGNDFNDIDLLAWAGKSYVVGQGLINVESRFPVVAPCHQDGFCEAVSNWHRQCIGESDAIPWPPRKNP